MQTNTYILFFLVSNLLNSFQVLCGQSDSLVLGCGLVKGGVDLYGTDWAVDTPYLNAGKSITMEASFQDPTIKSPIPYMTTRIFTSEATYKFPVRPDKRYLLRLYFYPVFYGKFNPANSYFSLTANDVTLLKNFSASITCQAFSQAYLVREFSLAAFNKSKLDIRITPSGGYFAFLNAIELHQIPNIFQAAKIVGSSEKIDLSNSNSQTMYRLNVGGNSIPRERDSGLTRTWNDDLKNLNGAAFGRVDICPGNTKIQYKGMPEYIAPPEVYSSCRSMGADERLTLSYNLTWSFQVDPYSNYMLRFHWCDFHHTKPNQQVFSLFVNNQSEGEVDIIELSGGRATAIYRDYFIHFEDVSGDQKLLVALHPSTKRSPEFLDASLNGIEIFKVSHETRTLASPNPEIKKSILKKNYPYKLFRGVLGAIVVILMTVLCVVVYLSKKPLSKSIENALITRASQGICQYFAFAELQKATDSFNESNIIGIGGFGKVFKGVLDGSEVAIKRSIPSSDQGVHEFETEIEILSQLRHNHLVSLIGFSKEKNSMFLVYQFVPGGTLTEHLYQTKQPHSGKQRHPLSWKQRLEVCIGAARGLDYLHKGFKYPIIHRDVKSSNILLDENRTAKLADFGLSKTDPSMNNGGHVTTAVKGTAGYLDPHYYKTEHLTEKTDVFSFGVLLFEVLTARPVVTPNVPKEQINLADWALHCKCTGVIDKIIDTNIKGKIHSESLEIFVDIAAKCLDEVPQERPSMGEVLRNLELALQLQETQNSSSGREEGASLM